jgi:hypothetical protein
MGQDLNIRAGSFSRFKAAALWVAALSLFAAAVTAPAAAADKVRPVQPRDRSAVPQPHQVQTRSGPLKQAKTALVPFQTAPFPYRGTLPGSGSPFLNITHEGRLGHSTPFGRVYWEDETYNDPRVLLYIPKGYDVRRPTIMVVFFHGHGATLERDVIARQKVAEQISRSGANAVLVAPQLALDASDSSAGRFWEPGAFGKFMGEAAEQLALLHGDRKSVRTFASSPVMIVAYSGGYLTAASCLSHGGLGRRIRGVVLLDALYGELDTFTSWLEKDRSAFLVSAYLGSTLDENAALSHRLTARGIPFSSSLGKYVTKGSITILPGYRADGTPITHRDFVTHAWADQPISDILRRLREFRP